MLKVKILSKIKILLKVKILLKIKILLKVKILLKITILLKVKILLKITILLKVKILLAILPEISIFNKIFFFNSEIIENSWRSLWYYHRYKYFVNTECTNLRVNSVFTKQIIEQKLFFMSSLKSQEVNCIILFIVHHLILTAPFPRKYIYKI